MTIPGFKRLVGRVVQSQQFAVPSLAAVKKRKYECAVLDSVLFAGCYTVDLFCVSECQHVLMQI